MKDRADLLSQVVDRTLDVIFAKYPARTGLGVVLGATCAFLARLFAPALRDFSAIDADSAPLWGWLALGILVMHAPTIKSIFGQRLVGNDPIDQVLDLIDRGNFSSSERRQQYRNVISKASANIALNNAAQRDVSNLERSLEGSDQG
jgi:hypothetical protein